MLMHASCQMIDGRQKVIYYINSLLWNFYYKQIHPDRKYTGAMEMERDFWWVSLEADKNVLELEGVVGVQPCEYINITALYILYGSYLLDGELCHNKNM